MKFLIIILFLTLGLNAENDTALSDAFTKGKFLGNITLFDYNVDKKNEKNAYATALGGFLKYSTDESNPLFASVRLHQSSPLGPNQNKILTQLFNNDRNASSLTALSEAFLAYRYKSRILKVGNMMLNTPMMNDDTTRIVPWSYQGAAFTSEPFADTKIQLYHITQIRKNTSDEYTKVSASGEFDHGISMLGITYKGLNEITLQSYYYYAPELYNTFIAQMDYQHVVNEDYLFSYGVQYFQSSDGGKYNNSLSRNGGDDINLLAFRVGIDGPKYNVTLNYSQNYGLSGIVKGYGGLAKVFTTSMVANGRGNFKPETWMLTTHFDVDPFEYGKSEFAISLTNTRVHDERGDDFDAFYSHFRHYFDVHTSLYIRFEAIDYHDSLKNDVNYLRIIASYNF